MQFHYDFSVRPASDKYKAQLLKQNASEGPSSILGVLTLLLRQTFSYLFTLFESRKDLDWFDWITIKKYGLFKASLFPIFFLINFTHFVPGGILLSWIIILFGVVTFACINYLLIPCIPRNQFEFRRKSIKKNQRHIFKAGRKPCGNLLGTLWRAHRWYPRNSFQSIPRVSTQETPIIQGFRPPLNVYMTFIVVIYLLYPQFHRLNKIFCTKIFLQ